MYFRVTEEASGDFEDEYFVTFLIYSASRLQQHVRVCRTFQQFSHMECLKKNSDILDRVGKSASEIGDAALNLKVQQLNSEIDAGG